MLKQQGLIETILHACGDCVDLAIFMSLSVYERGPSAKSFHIIMATDHLVWLARPTHKHPEMRKGTDCPQKTRKCRFNSFCVVVAVVNGIQAVFFFAKPIIQELHEP